MKKNQIIYQVFVRNYSKEGTFKKVEEDLSRIKELGTDILYLMPIHEIGIEQRKGTYGSPYAIKDYFSICELYGNKEDFISLVNKTHEHGMKIILDMVFNHTAPDNVLVKEHPEYYYYKNGKLGNRVGDWSDIVDLDTYRDDTQEYLLSVLKYWVSLGVDGFRFDVASMISLDFFKKARKALKEKIIFIGESIEPEFGDYLRSLNSTATRDEDMFPTFDSLYNYSWSTKFHKYLKKEVGIDELIDALQKDEDLLFNHGYRLNCLENHDLDRIYNEVNKEQLKSLIEFIGFIKGDVFIYMYQEYGVKHKPELFEKDYFVEEKDLEILSWYKNMINEKKNESYNPLIRYRFSKVNDSTLKVEKILDNKVIASKSFCF